jgi:stearoyl-CoA desaturase (delta-9 desaturase)
MSKADRVASTRALLAHVNWETTLFLVFTPFIALYGVFTASYMWQTWVFSLFAWCFGLMGMTTVYHRMYSHRSCKVARPVELWWLFWATTDFSMSALDWVRDHRAHHKYTDTDKDPYNINKGFWWAHIGWLVWKRERPNSDISDLEQDKVLEFQHAYFNECAIFSGWVLPTLICGLLWGDFRGGFFIAAVLKTVALHHCIFCINSLAHYCGDGPFNDMISPRENLLCAILTMGEGYHNFHHEFPNDYRNGVHLTAFDPTKWCIALLEKVGLASDLKRTPKDRITLSRLQMALRKVEREKENIFIGKPIAELPFLTRAQIMERCEYGEKLVIKGDIVYDVKQFQAVHPGGELYIKNNIGKDITHSFQGGVYGHSNAANNVLDKLRCGRILKHA